MAKRNENVHEKFEASFKRLTERKQGPGPKLTLGRWKEYFDERVAYGKALVAGGVGRLGVWNEGKELTCPTESEVAKLNKQRRALLLRFYSLIADYCNKESKATRDAFIKVCHQIYKTEPEPGSNMSYAPEWRAYFVREAGQTDNQTYALQFAVEPSELDAFNRESEYYEDALEFFRDAVSDDMYRDESGDINFKEPDIMERFQDDADNWLGMVRDVAGKVLKEMNIKAPRKTSFHPSDIVFILHDIEFDGNSMCRRR